jgi:hypothetical protein
LGEIVDHVEAESPTIGEHFRDYGGAADERDQVFCLHGLLLHAEVDGGDGIGQIDGKVFFLVELDECREHFGLGLDGHGKLDAGGVNFLIIGMCVDDTG